MTNQAAQKMPETLKAIADNIDRLAFSLPAPNSVTPELVGQAIHLRTFAAALSQAAGVAEDIMSHFCNAIDNLNDMPVSDEWARKWTAKAEFLIGMGPDPSAVPISAAPAASGGEESIAWTEKERRAIAEMMATQEFSYAALMRQAVRLYQHNLMRRKDGETCTWSGDEKRAREFAGMFQPPAAASVSERARALLAAEYRAAGFNAAADWIAEADMDAEENDLDRCVIRALEQALTQQRGECYCQSCKGSGEVIGLHASPSGDPQDAYEAPMACPKCDGTGDAK